MNEPISIDLNSPENMVPIERIYPENIANKEFEDGYDFPFTQGDLTIGNLLIKNMFEHVTTDMFNDRMTAADVFDYVNQFADHPYYLHRAHPYLEAIAMEHNRSARLPVFELAKIAKNTGIDIVHPDVDWDLDFSTNKANFDAKVDEQIERQREDDEAILRFRFPELYEKEAKKNAAKESSNESSNETDVEKEIKSPSAEAKPVGPSPQQARQPAAQDPRDNKTPSNQFENLAAGIISAPISAAATLIEQGFKGGKKLIESSRQNSITELNKRAESKAQQMSRVASNLSSATKGHKNADNKRDKSAYESEIRRNTKTLNSLAKFAKRAMENDDIKPDVKEKIQKSAKQVNRSMTGVKKLDAPEDIGAEASRIQELMKNIIALFNAVKNYFTKDKKDGESTPSVSA